MEKQLDILSQSLDRKLEVLKRIQEYNRLQEESFRDGTAKLEDFDEAVEEKGRLIQEVNQLDEGFELLYDGLSKELQGNAARYAPQIRVLQDKIAQVTDMSVSVQAQEKRNKKLIEDFFAQERVVLRQARKTSKAAYGYYKNMNASSQSQFYDNKK